VVVDLGVGVVSGRVNEAPRIEILVFVDTAFHRARTSRGKALYWLQRQCRRGRSWLCSVIRRRGGGPLGERRVFRRSNEVGSAASFNQIDVGGCATTNNPCNSSEVVEASEWPRSVIGDSMFEVYEDGDEERRWLWRMWSWWLSCFQGEIQPRQDSLNQGWIAIKTDQALLQSTSNAEKA
jgi:hypothetical protein